MSEIKISRTLSQAGMARHLWNSQNQSGSAMADNSGWRWKIVINGIGSFITAIVTLIFAVTKFADDVRIIVLLLPAIVISFYAIHRHYASLARDLSLEHYGQPPPFKRQRVIMPVSSIHQGTLEVLDYALSLAQDVTVVHISTDPEQTEKLKQRSLIKCIDPHTSILYNTAIYQNEILTTS